jgi:hypothetical protein
LGEALVGGWKSKSKKEQMQSLTGSFQGVNLNFRTLAGRSRGSSTFHTGDVLGIAGNIVDKSVGLVGDGVEKGFGAVGAGAGGVLKKVGMKTAGNLMEQVESLSRLFLLRRPWCTYLVHIQGVGGVGLGLNKGLGFVGSTVSGITGFGGGLVTGVTSFGVTSVKTGLGVTKGGMFGKWPQCSRLV